MEIQILEYERYKAGKIRVQSHTRSKGKWKPNPRFEFHKIQSKVVFEYPVKNRRIYTKEVN